MTRRAILLVALSALVLGLPLLALVCFDAFWFSPRLGQIRTLVATAHPEDRTPPVRVRQLVLTSTGDTLTWEVTKIVLYQSKPTNYYGTTQSNRYSLLSYLLVSIHVSRAEALSIYCSRVYVGDGSNGLSTAAGRMFQKPLSALTTNEAAAVVALPWAPGYFAKHPRALAARQGLLLQQVRFPQ